MKRAGVADHPDVYFLDAVETLSRMKRAAQNYGYSSWDDEADAGLACVRSSLEGILHDLNATQGEAAEKKLAQFKKRYGRKFPELLR